MLALVVSDLQSVLLFVIIVAFVGYVYRSTWISWSTRIHRSPRRAWWSGIGWPEWLSRPTGTIWIHWTTWISRTARYEYKCIYD